MAIPSHGVLAVCFLGLDPDVLLGVKHPQTGVIFFAVITSENIEFPFVQRGGVVLDLRGLAYHWSDESLSCLWAL